MEDHEAKRQESTPVHAGNDVFVMLLQVHFPDQQSFGVVVELGELIIRIELKLIQFGLLIQYATSLGTLYLPGSFTDPCVQY